MEQKYFCETCRTISRVKDNEVVFSCECGRNKLNGISHIDNRELINILKNRKIVK